MSETEKQKRKENVEKKRKGMLVGTVFMDEHTIKRWRSLMDLWVSRSDPQRNPFVDVNFEIASNEFGEFELNIVEKGVCDRMDSVGFTFMFPKLVKLVRQVSEGELCSYVEGS